MLKLLKQWFGFAKKEAKEENKLAFCLQTPTSAQDAKDKIVVVCKGAELKLRKDGALPDSLKPGEVCWFLPSGDVRLPITFQYDATEIRATIVLRFEGDRRFALYAANLLASGKDGITETDLARFVAGQWSELMTLQNITPEQLQKPDVVARFRTHLSLLLQENGFRCIGIETVEMPTAKTVETKSPELPTDASQELVTAVEQSATETGWDDLLDQLDDAGFVPYPSDAETLEQLGSNYRDRKISADDAALQIRRMIERNNLEIGLISERVAQWNATEVKLRLLDSLDEKPEEYLLASAQSLGKAQKVPSTWYILRQRKVDEKLQKYLKGAAKNLSELLATAMQRQAALENKSKLASAQSTLQRVADKLAMTPNLGVGTKSMQRRQRNLDDLVQAVRRSITATQLAEGLLRSLVSDDYPKEQYLDMVADVNAALTTLEREIDDRKNIYGV